MFNDKTIENFDKVVLALEDYYVNDFRRSVIGVKSICESGVFAVIENSHCSCCSSDYEVEYFSFEDLELTSEGE